MGDAQAVPLHLVDMRRPHVDKGHVLAGPRHMRSGVTAHRTRPDNCDPFAHGHFSELILADPNLQGRKFIAQSRRRSVAFPI
jgi:hypothetical protein